VQGFQVDFFVHSKDAEPRFVGTAHLLPPHENVSVYSKRVPIIGLNHRPIGEVQGMCGIKLLHKLLHKHLNVVFGTPK
jgi:hypothetical protein